MKTACIRLFSGERVSVAVDVKLPVLSGDSVLPEHAPGQWVLLVTRFDYGEVSQEGSGPLVFSAGVESELRPYFVVSFEPLSHTHSPKELS